MRSRLRGLAGGSESDSACANFVALARQADGDVRRQLDIGAWDSERKSRTETDVWEMTINMTYAGEEVYKWNPGALNLQKSGT